MNRVKMVLTPKESARFETDKEFKLAREAEAREYADRSECAVDLFTADEKEARFSAEPGDAVKAVS